MLYFSGSEILNYSVIEISDDSYVICADAGYLHAKGLGLFRTVLLEILTPLGEIPKNIEVIRYRAEKDDTDTMLAVKLALEKGYTDICIYGALGGI